MIRTAILAALGLASIAGAGALAEPTRATFPDLSALEHYATVRRGESTEHMMTSREAIAAAQAGETLPDGTHVVLVDYRGGEIYRVFVMQKGAGWGADYAERERTGDWHYQWYWPDGSINTDENTARCRSCHGRSRETYMFTYDDLIDYDGTPPS